MSKNNINYLFIFLSLILLIGTSFFGYEYILNNKRQQFLSSIANFEEYSDNYYKDINKVNDVLSGIDATLDYTTCLAYLNKYKELHEKFNQDETKKLLFLNDISVNKECNNQIDKYSSLINTTKNNREDWRIKTEKWCYGYHKVDYNDSWTEEYVSPLNSAYDEMVANEDKLGTAFSDAKVSCLKQIIS